MSAKAVSLVLVALAAIGCSSSSGSPADASTVSAPDAKDVGGDLVDSSNPIDSAATDLPVTNDGNGLLDVTTADTTTTVDAHEAAAQDEGEEAPVDTGSSTTTSDAMDTAEAGRDTGPAPSTVCGHNVNFFSACAALCGQVDSNCTDANRQFDSIEACNDLCTAPMWSCGSPGDLTGNTVFCRETHAEAAATAADPAAECGNAGPNSSACR